VIITADWVLPVSAPPIREGAVAVREGVVVEVGPTADVCSRWLDDPVEDLSGCILAPGLVNAHTHLALSVLGGLTGRGPLHPWLGPVTRAILGLSHEEFGASSAAGALDCLLSGTTAVGDIVYGAETPTSVRDVGLAGVFFWELLGLDPEGVEESLAHRGYSPGPTGRVRPGLSPHAPYSSGPALLQHVRDLARASGQPFAIHVGETAGEVELLRSGGGPFRDQADRLAHGFEVPGASPVRYLDALGILDDAICIHAVHVDAADAELLARCARGVVLCPRSNAFLENGVPPVSLLRRAGVRLALGTDSSASNDDLDMFAEARALASIDPTIRPSELLAMMTREAARLLAIDDSFGALEPGMQADLVGVRVSVEPGHDPVAAFLNADAPSAIAAVMSGGGWRVRDGQATFDTSALEAEASAARDHAKALLASG
jgi:cytosine/adenosine deaminase-related metal-dependent hydrolase